MKTLAAALLIAIGIVLTSSAQSITKEPARLKNKVTQYEGKIGSHDSVTAINAAADDHPGTAGSHVSTTRGKESELHWTYLGRKGDKDVYSFTFTRMTKAGSPQTTTDTKQVEFEGKRIIVFEDALHA